MTALETITRTRVVAVLRASDAARFADIAEVLADAGITCIEFTLSSAGSLEALRKFADLRRPDVVLGAGTVLDAASASAAVEAGATYLISPALCLDVLDRGIELGVPVLPGACTPSEILQAWRAGASAVKVFPAAQAGGPAYIEAVRAPLPHIPLVPTGGIVISEAAAYLRAGALAVGLGGPLLGDAGTGGDLGALHERALDLVGRVGEVQS
ncbi:MAG: bifunctional 4-hydroxy-2-oxoglutarate aldolase/2-dehydro-3-deoxy-phosphogluconate aldolase [Pseudonocardiales bacterium]